MSGTVQFFLGLFLVEDDYAWFIDCSEVLWRMTMPVLLLILKPCGRHLCLAYKFSEALLKTTMSSL